MPDRGVLKLTLRDCRHRPAGDPESQVALAGLYEAGLGVPRDDREAADWYRKAAIQGHRIARINLGEAYARGHGVKRDLVRAWYWLGLAAADGSAWARKRQAGLARLMTAGNRRRAAAMLDAAMQAK